MHEFSAPAIPALRYRFQSKRPVRRVAEHGSLSDGTRMDENVSTVRLVGVMNPAALDEYFAGGMVDIAYVDRIDGDRVDLLLDGIDISEPDNREWLRQVLRHALNECGEEQAHIHFLVPLQT